MNDCDRCLNFNDCKLDKPKKSCSFVNDDMCIWRKDSWGLFPIKTSCENSIDVNYGYKFCPYCGKKIREVD